MDNKEHSLDEVLDDLLQHAGVKGMKWGVRKDAAGAKGMRLGDRSKMKKMTTDSQRQKHLDARDQKWLDKSKNSAKLQKVAKRTSRDMRKVNKELKKEHGGGVKRTFDRQAQAKFQKELKSSYDDILAGHTYAVYKLSPTRTREVEITSTSSGSLKARVVERDTPKLNKQRAAITKAANKNLKREVKQANKDSIKHADSEEVEDDILGMFFTITMDEDGYPDNVIGPFDDEEGDEDMTHKLDDVVEDVLQHYGVSGMKWGVTRSESAKSAAAEGGGGGEAEEEEDDESLLEEMGDKLSDVMKALDTKMDKIGDSVLKKGVGLFNKLFPTTGTTTHINPDGSRRVVKNKNSNSKTRGIIPGKSGNNSAGGMKRNKEMERALKKYAKAGKKEKELMKKGLRVSVSSVTTKPKKTSKSSTDEVSLKKRTLVAKKNNEFNDARRSNNR